LKRKEDFEEIYTNYEQQIAKDYLTQNTGTKKTQQQQKLLHPNIPAWSYSNRIH
jgi:hypothetical protein